MGGDEAVTHTLIPTEDWDRWQLERGILSDGTPVKFINDDQMIDQHGRVYTLCNDRIMAKRYI